MKPKTLFRNLAIQRKLLLVTLTICATVLVVALAAILSSQILSFRASFKRDTATLAGIIADNSTAALAFNDRKAAAEIIGSLKAKPDVLYACLVNAHEEVVAEFGNRTVPHTLASFPQPEEFRFARGLLLYAQPVTLDDKKIGCLYLCADYRSVLLRLLRFYGLITVLVLAGSVFITLLLSQWLGPIITAPLLGLAETARLVGERNDYSVRSNVSGFSDEVGRLAAAFNQMLERIEHQDAALNLSQQKLEALINSINGIVWERNPMTSQYTYVSQQAGPILGYPPEAWLANPKFWDQIVHPHDLAKASGFCQEALARRLPYHYEYRMVSADQRVLWIRESGTVILDNGKPAMVRGIFQDITEPRLAAEELKKLNRRLLETSRQAGMAEVATGVLHNVGNVLNSVNVSATLLHDQMLKSQFVNLQRVAVLLREHAGDLPQYLATDAKGRLLPGFIIQVADVLGGEQTRWLDELKSLKRNVEHMKEIVAMQQSFGRVSGVMESLDIKELVEDALHINDPGLRRLGVEIVRQYQAVPPVMVDKHKVMQILINVVSNAKYALEQHPSNLKRLKIQIVQGSPGRVQIAVEDNGIGISKENLTRIFGLGFTTKRNGHGFGLHSGALAAKELGGALAAHSNGPGTGAIFTLELPTANAPGN